MRRMDRFGRVPDALLVLADGAEDQRSTAMESVLPWITRGVLTLTHGEQVFDVDHHAEFEQVDGQRLDAFDFRASASIRLEPTYASPPDLAQPCRCAILGPQTIRRGRQGNIQPRSLPVPASD